MTLVDAGPLVALIDASQPAHERCRETLDRIPLPLLTTWPAFTEAMHLLRRQGGWRAQRAAWLLVERDELRIAAPSSGAAQRAAALMEKYSDKPMDLADATLVALAEERDLRRVFTLDADFHVYRLNGRKRFDVVPG